MSLFEVEQRNTNKIVIKSGNKKKSIKNYFDTICNHLTASDEVKIVGVGILFTYL
jgi:hypothetical protein